MQPIKNYYFILGVPRGASAVEIQAVYESARAIAENDEIQASMMGEVEEAYACLSDPSRRREYDASFGEPPQLSTAIPSGGNAHNFRSAESTLSVEIAYNKARNKQKFKKKILNDIVMGIIFLSVAGAGIHYGVKFFVKEKLPVGIPAELFRVNKVQEPPEPEKPIRTIATMSGNKPVVRTYDVQTGGVVTKDRSPCRPQPSYTSRATTEMRKDTLVFATKEVRDKDGSLWYYVSSRQSQGWMNGSDVTIYKF
jgi:hypothetical protein